MGQSKSSSLNRWSLMFIAIGMAVGTGNIWRFPRLVAAYGGGSFIIMYLFAVFVWSFPLLMAEAGMGKASRMGVAGAFRTLVGKKYTWLGVMVGMSILFMASYYSVICGWCLRYFGVALSGGVAQGVDTQALWDTFSTSHTAMIPWHIITMLFCSVIIVTGMTQGISKACSILIPSLVVLLLLCAVRAWTLPNASKGLEFIFTVKAEPFFNAQYWIQAFSQAAWSTGAGAGSMVTYYAFAKKDEDIPLNCMMTCFSDTAVALLAAMIIFPTIFSLSPDPIAATQGGNAGLTFIHMTALFSIMPGGKYVAAAFFLALFFAGLSSQFTHCGIGVRMLEDFGINQKKASAIICLGLMVVGLPSAMDIVIQGNQDHVWGISYFLMGMASYVALMKIGVSRAWDNFIAPYAELDARKFLNLIYLFPVWSVVTLCWWMYQTILDYPGEWYRVFPIHTYTYSFGTVIFQIGIVMLILILINKMMSANATHDHAAVVEGGDLETMKNFPLVKD